MVQRPRIAVGRRGIGHFRFLLAAMVSMLALRPFLEGYVHVGLATDVFFALILLSGAYALNSEGKVFVVAVGLLIPVLLLGVASQLMLSETVYAIKSGAVALFLAYILAIILLVLFRQREFSEDLITGAVCAYLLIGTLWSFVFYFLEVAEDGSFTNVGTVVRDIGPFVYFSFVTLATLGYGDIVPVTGPARSLAVLEAVTGQLFLAITLARLVGVHATQSRSAKGAT